MVNTLKKPATLQHISTYMSTRIGHSLVYCMKTWIGGYQCLEIIAIATGFHYSQLTETEVIAVGPGFHSHITAGRLHLHTYLNPSHITVLYE